MDAIQNIEADSNVFNFNSAYGYVHGFIEELLFDDPAVDRLWELNKLYAEEETNIPMKY